MTSSILVYGYGNPGRRDDGLGPALADRLDGSGAPPGGEGVTVERAYQLQVEDAALVAEHDVVVFVDAHRSCPAPFEMQRLVPRGSVRFSTHSMAPQDVLAFAREQLGCRTEGFLLGIRGYEFDEYGEGLSRKATENLAAAVEVLRGWLRDGSLAKDGKPATGAASAAPAQP
ncbi:hydrogenase maturation protease [bacterium]|nr:hydrogenase maturation protease [bacterium]